MKKRNFAVFLAILCIAVLTFSLSSCEFLYFNCDHEGFHGEPVVENVTSAVGSQPGSYDEVVYCTRCKREVSRITVPVYDNPVSSEALTVESSRISGGIPSQNQTIDLDDFIVILDGCTARVSSDEAGENLLDKDNISLVRGNNIFYLSVTDPNGVITDYTLELYLKTAYTVQYFMYSPGTGGPNYTMTVDEGDCVEPYPFERPGYVITEWRAYLGNGSYGNFDFSKPVTKNYTLVAVWDIDRNIKYTVEYYFQNIDDDEYTIDETKTFIGRGAAGDYVKPQTPTYEGFALKGNYASASYKILVDGSLTIKVYYNRNSYTVKATASSSGYTSITAGYVSGGGTLRYGDEATVRATTRPGYIFNGWYLDGNRVSTNEQYTFVVSGSATLLAKWSYRTDVPYKIVYRLQDSTTNDYHIAEAYTVTGTGKTGDTVYAEIKTFPGFHHITNKGQEYGTISGDGSTVINVFYDRDTYNIEAVPSSIVCGTVTGAGQHRFGADVTLYAHAYSGYKFDGWYLGEDLVSTETELTLEVTEAKSFVAQFSVKDDVRYVVEYYLETVRYSYPNHIVVWPSSPTHREERTGTTGQYVEISNYTTATEAPVAFEGYSFNYSNSNGKIKGNISGDGSLVLKLYYTVSKPKITVTSSNTNAGTVSPAVNERLPYGLSLTLTATAKNGYTFAGWYVNDELVSTDAEYRITVTEARDYVAKWTGNPTTYKIKHYKVDLTGFSEEYSEYRETVDSFAGETVRAEAVEALLSQGLILLTDKSTLGGTVLPDGALTLNLYYASPTCYRDGNYVYLGEYPQTVKAPEVAITATIDERGYYLGSDGYYYAKLTAAPRGTIYFSNGTAIVSGDTYYFKVEPIRWRVIKDYDADGQSTIICDSVISMQKWNGYSSDYPSSSIRQWLNGEFYNAAFSQSEKNSITTTTVLNSLNTMGPNATSYAPIIYDKIYLASYQDAVSSTYGFKGANLEDEAKFKIATDYARAMGVMVYDNGGSWWWLRSPDISGAASAVNPYGICGKYYSQYMNLNGTGVAPVMRIPRY